MELPTLTLRHLQEGQVIKKSAIILLLACALPLRELHTFFSSQFSPGIFPLDKDYITSPEWHVHFIVTKLLAVVAFSAWYYREQVMDFYFARFIGVYTIFYVMDFVLYLLEHSRAGLLYFIGYLIVLIYATFTIFKSK